MAIKYSETKLPLNTLHASAIKEKARGEHPGALHLWWNRTPIASTAALLFASLTNSLKNYDCNKKWQHLFSALAGNDPYAFTKAMQFLAEEKLPSITDPFSGFGGIVIAAAKLGLEVNAADLNPVAVLLTQAATDISGRFVIDKPVQPKAESQKLTQAAALAEDVAYYGAVLEEKAQKKLEGLYPGLRGEKPYGYLWVRTVSCPNPACRCDIPLGRTFVLTKAKGRECWAEPLYNNGSLSFAIHQGICPAEKESNKAKIKSAKFFCPVCASLVEDEYLKQMGSDGQLKSKLMAVVTYSEKGKKYSLPDEEQILTAKVVTPEDTPVGEMPDNSRWFSPPVYGIKRYIDLYTPRQMTMLLAFCELLPEIQKQAARDALLAGMNNKDIALKDGGSGAAAYGEAIGVYLALTISKMSNYNSMACSWDNRQGGGRAAFFSQAIPMTWTFFEANPFSSATGNFHTMLTNVVQAVKNLPVTGKVCVRQQDAVTADYEENTIICTELPYYDNVGYADLSDYFYIWLRRCLKNTYPDLFKPLLTFKDELCSIPEHYNNDKKTAIAAYKDGLAKWCRNIAAKVSGEFPSLVFYLFTEQDKKAIRERSAKETAFEYLLASMLKAGFTIKAVLPVRNDKPSARKATRVLVIFCKGKRLTTAITKRNFLLRLKQELALHIKESEEYIEIREDLQITALGRGLSLFTSYEEIWNADGTDLDLHTAILLIAQEIDSCLDNLVNNTAQITDNNKDGGYSDAKF